MLVNKLGPLTLRNKRNSFGLIVIFAEDNYKNTDEKPLRECRQCCLRQAHKGKRLLLDLCKQSSWTVLHPSFHTDKSFADYAACKTSQTHPAALKSAAALTGHPQSSFPLGKLLKFCLLLRLVEFLGHKWCLEKKKQRTVLKKGLPQLCIRPFVSLQSTTQEQHR